MHWPRTLPKQMAEYNAHPSLTEKWNDIGWVSPEHHWHPPSHISHFYGFAPNEHPTQRLTRRDSKVVCTSFLTIHAIQSPWMNLPLREIGSLSLRSRLSRLTANQNSKLPLLTFLMVKKTRFFFSSTSKMRGMTGRLEIYQCEKRISQWQMQFDCTTNALSGSFRVDVHPSIHGSNQPILASFWLHLQELFNQAQQRSSSEVRDPCLTTLESASKLPIPRIGNEWLCTCFTNGHICSTWLSSVMLLPPIQKDIIDNDGSGSILKHGLGWVREMAEHVIFSSNYVMQSQSLSTQEEKRHITDDIDTQPNNQCWKMVFTNANISIPSIQSHTIRDLENYHWSSVYVGCMYIQT